MDEKQLVGSKLYIKSNLTLKHYLPIYFSWVECWFRDTFNKLKDPVWWSVEKKGRVVERQSEEGDRRQIMEGLVSQSGDLGPVEEFKVDEFPDLATVWRVDWRGWVYLLSPLDV